MLFPGLLFNLSGRLKRFDGIKQFHRAAGRYAPASGIR